MSYMKCRYVDGKYMHFMTDNTPPTHTLRALLIPEQRKELNPRDISKNSSAIIARE
jgi:hypothetical protein